MLTKLWSKKGKSSKSQNFNGIIRVIGDRSSGKTTYMAALARWPKADQPGTDKALVKQVQAINDDGEQLISKARNLLEQGESLEPTRLDATPSEVKDYCLRIVLKGNFSRNNINGNQDSNSINIDINCKDYAGEFFADLLYKSNSSILQDYMEDCAQANGILLLLDGMGFRQDIKIVGGLEKFLIELDRADIEPKHRRIAIVITKCEQPELWVNRHDPNLIVKARFPRVVQHLKQWEQSGLGNIDCFATSAFGMVGNRYQKPNMECISRDLAGIKASVIRYPKKWQPFGLVAPIYWLCTGTRHPKLDFE